MISEIGMKNFKHLRGMFDKLQSGKFGGSSVVIGAIKEHMSISSFQAVDPRQARNRIHKRIRKWAEVAKRRPLYEEYSFVGDPEVFTRPKSEPRYTAYWWEMILLYYDLLALAAYESTIEELIARVRDEKATSHLSKVQCDAIKNLLALNSAFLLADWMTKLIHKAVANADGEVLHAIGKGLLQDTSLDRRDTANRWLNVILLWYLGGVDLPRKEFKWILIDLRIISVKMSDSSFRGMLANLGLTGKNKRQ